MLTKLRAFVRFGFCNSKTPNTVQDTIFALASGYSRSPISVHPTLTPDNPDKRPQQLPIPPPPIPHPRHPPPHPLIPPQTLKNPPPFRPFPEPLHPQKFTNRPGHRHLLPRKEQLQWLGYSGAASSWWPVGYKAVV